MGLRYFSFIGVAALSVLALSVGAVAVSAQSLTRSGQPSVEVNTRVLDALGPGPGYYFPPENGARAVGPGSFGRADSLPPPRSRLLIAPPQGGALPQDRSSTNLDTRPITRSTTSLPIPPQPAQRSAPPSAASVAPVPGVAPGPAPAPAQPGAVVRNVPSSRTGSSSSSNKAPPPPPRAAVAATAPDNEIPSVPAHPRKPVASAPVQPPSNSTAALPPPPPPAAEPAKPAVDSSLTLPPPPSANAGSVNAGGVFGRVGGSAPPPPPPATAEPREVSPPAPTPPPAAPPQKLAAVPPPANVQAAPATSTSLSLPFEAQGQALSGDAESQLASLAQRLRGSQERIQVNAYASGDNASSAKRLALSRALTVRSYLTEKGIASTRIDVRAVGPAETGPKDRVDIQPAGR